MLQCLKCGQEFIYAAIRNTEILEDVLETRVCPYCQCLDIREVEPIQAKISSVVSVKICEADEWIAKGYEVKDTYASTVTLVKREKEVEKP